MGILVDLERVTARRPDRPLFESLSLTVSTGDRLGVVGVNGTGKSTLLRVLAGVSEPESGVVRRGRGGRVGFLDQQPVLPAGPVRAAVGSGWEAAEILERLGMGGLADADVATLSGGQAKRVALARVLVAEVDLLVLDEPTNHLDIDAIGWLEARLARFRGGLVLVTHDRHVLDRVTTRMLELDRGRTFTHEGGYTSYLDARAARVEQEAGADAVRRNLARAELAWLRRGAPARTRKPKARIAAATAIVEGQPPPPPAGTGPIDLGPGGPTGWTGAGPAKPTPTPRLGDKVVNLHGGGHRFGDGGPWLFRGLDVDLEPGGRLAIVGPNGSGKTTLLDILAGRLEPTEGRLERAGTVVLSYYDQTGRDLDPDRRVREAVAGKAAQPGWEQARLMERFRFDSDLQWATIGTLSGGERRRLQLLLALTSFPNVLLLDEPTNDLDLDTLRALEDFLETWPGSLVVVSHDRALLERTAEEAIVLDGHGGAAFAPGGYAQYEEARRRRSEDTAPRPGAARAREVHQPPLKQAARRVGSAPPGSGAPAPPPGRKPRSPSTLRRLIGLAEAEMEKAAAERDGLLDDLAAAGGDHVAVARVAETLAAAEARLSAAEERWLELSEELGG